MSARVSLISELENAIARGSNAQSAETLRRLTDLFTGRAAETAVGAVVAILGIILILPIPLLGTLPPGFATAILALGLLEQDGVVVAVGIVASVIAFALCATMTWAAILGILQLF